MHYAGVHEEFVKRLSHHSYVQFCRAVAPLYCTRIVPSRPRRLDWMWRLLCDHPANEVQTRLNNHPDRFLFEIHDLKTHYTKHMLQGYSIYLLMPFFVVYKLHFIVANVNSSDRRRTCMKSLRSVITSKCTRFPLGIIIDLSLITQFIWLLTT